MYRIDDEIQETKYMYNVHVYKYIKEIEVQIQIFYGQKIFLLFKKVIDALMILSLDWVKE